ncbi:MAG: B12-binding domain-containing protein [Nocardioidaceae bacterium]
MTTCSRLHTGWNRGASTPCSTTRWSSSVSDSAIWDVLMPAMRQIGYWWEGGRCEVVHEHMATEAVRAWLNRLLYLGPSPWQPETLILACGPRDLHTLGLESMGVLLARRGFGCRTLGARTPVKSLAMAVQGTGAAGVVLVSHLSVGRRSAVDALRAVQPSGLPSSTPATRS